MEHASQRNHPGCETQDQSSKTSGITIPMLWQSPRVVGQDSTPFEVKQHKLRAQTVHTYQADSRIKTSNIV